MSDFIPEVQAVLDKMFTNSVSQLHGDLESVRAFGNVLILKFTDGRWAAFRAAEYDDGIEIFLLKYPEIINYYTLYDARLITLKQYQEQEKWETELQKQKIETQEEEIYQRVKARKDAKQAL